MSSLLMDKAVDAERSRLQGEIDDLAQRHDAVKTRVEQYEAYDELSGDDERSFQRLSDDAQMLRAHLKAAQNRLVKLDIGSPADANKDRMLLNEQIREFAIWGRGATPSKIGDDDDISFATGADFVFDYDSLDVAAAFENPEIWNDPIGRPSEGYVTTAIARLVRRLNSFGGMSVVCERLVTPTGNDINLFTMDSTLTGDGFSETSKDSVDSSDASVKVIVSKRNGYRSKLFVLPLSNQRDAVFNFERALTQTLANQIGRAFAQNLVKGDIANTDVQGFAAGATVLRTGSGNTSATSRKIGGQTIQQLSDRIEAIEAVPPTGAIYGEGGEGGFNPINPNVAWVMNRRTWSILANILRISNSTLITVGQHPLARVPVTMLNSAPVIFDDTFDAPGANGTFAVNALILGYGNFRSMLDRRIGRVRLHRDPYGTPGQNAQVGLMLFAEGDNRFSEGFGTGGKAESVVLYQANAA